MQYWLSGKTNKDTFTFDTYQSSFVYIHVKYVKKYRMIQGHSFILKKIDSGKVVQRGFKFKIHLLSLIEVEEKNWERGMDIQNV